MAGCFDSMRLDCECLELGERRNVVAAAVSGVLVSPGTFWHTGTVVLWSPYA